MILKEPFVISLVGRDYNKSFNKADQKLVDNILAERLTESNSGEISTIVDMTNMTIKRRRQTLQYFGKDFTKVAIIF